VPTRYYPTLIPHAEQKNQIKLVRNYHGKESIK
jgi:hypothetical protein